ncbi:MAG: hypothetical protein ACR2OU_17650 [Thermomicrobiales bacterium]
MFIASAALVLTLMLGAAGTAVSAAMAAPPNDAPCQNPISKPSVLVFIAQGLIFIPAISDAGNPGAFINSAAHEHGGLGHKDSASSATCD